MDLVHSVPAEPQPVPCRSVVVRPSAPLRPYVAGFSAFASGDGRAVRHRVLPFNLVTLVLDRTGRAPLVTGARDTPHVHPETAWTAGISVGLTPAGARALLGLPMSELTGATVPLDDVLGRSGSLLAERLAAAPDRRTRFAVLESALIARLDRTPAPDPVVQAAWLHLQRAADRPAVAALTGRFGVSRRYLEIGFRRQIGLPPGVVARIARFQRAVAGLARGAALSGTAADCGYADQPHFTRDIRRMSGLTPGRLCAFLQYRPS